MGPGLPPAQGVSAETLRWTEKGPHSGSQGGRKHPGPDLGFVPVLWLPSHGAGAKPLHSPKLGVSGTHPRYCIKTCADPREMHAMVFLRLSNSKQMEGGIMTSGASL